MSLGFGLFLGFPPGRSGRFEGTEPGTERWLAGKIEVNPQFEANIQATHNLAGTVNANPYFEGGLSPLRILKGRVDTDPDFTANLQATVGLRGTIQVNPDFEADMEEPISAPPVLPTFVGTSVLSVAGAGAFDLPYPTGTEEGDFLIFCTETARQFPVQFPDPDWGLIWEQGVGTGGTATACDLAIWAKFAEAGETALTTTTNINDHVCSFMASFRGVKDEGVTMADRVNGAQRSAGNGAGTAAGTTASFGAVSILEENSLLALIVATGADGATPGFTTTEGLTDATVHLQTNTALGNGGGLALATGSRDTTGFVTPNPTATLGASGPQYALRALELYGAPYTPPVYEGPVYVGGSTWSVAAGSTANLVGLPGSDGDLIVLACESARQNPLTTPSGFTFIGSVPLGTAGSTNSTQLTIYAGYRSGSTLSVTSASGIDHMAGVYLVFSGTVTGDLAGACEVLDTAALTSTAAQPVGPITPDGGNRMILVAAANGKDSSADEGTFGDLGGLANATQQQFRGTTTGNGGSVQVLTGERLDSGDITPIPSVSYLDSRPIAMAVIAINPTS